jgi:hypothetical protein
VSRADPPPASLVTTQNVQTTLQIARLIQSRPVAAAAAAAAAASGTSTTAVHRFTASAAAASSSSSSASASSRGFVTIAAVGVGRKQSTAGGFAASAAAAAAALPAVRMRGVTAAAATATALLTGAGGARGIASSAALADKAKKTSSVGLALFLFSRRYFAVKTPVDDSQYGPRNSAAWVQTPPRRTSPLARYAPCRPALVVKSITHVETYDRQLSDSLRIGKMRAAFGSASHVRSDLNLSM